MRNLIVSAVLAVLGAGCGSLHSFANRQEQNHGECQQLCAEYFHPMSMAHADGPLACQCWLPVSSWESARPQGARIERTALVSR